MSGSHPATARVLGERVFDDADQKRFAVESRDFNPIHVDPVAARRLISGRLLVHGVHTLIQALDLLHDPHAGGGVSNPAVQCNFVYPVCVGDSVRFSALPDWRGRQRLVATVHGVAATEILIGDGALQSSGHGGAAGEIDWTGGPVRTLGALPEPLDEPPQALVGQRFEIEAWEDALATLYPRAGARLGVAALSDLARLSFVVGMVCPGLHSVFLSLRFTVVTAGAPAPLRVKVSSYDSRYRLVDVAFEGALRGELRAMVRPAPQRQPGAAELVDRVAQGSWVGRRAMVIGGSRGLGETTAKLLAASGCDVTITHASGSADAAAVAREIGALGRGRCTTVPLDLSRVFVPPPGLAAADLDAVFYFATPRINVGRSGAFHRSAFDEFTAFYIERLYELCRWLEAGARPVRVYFPSTVFIDGRPRGMTEYTMAKAAAEVLADDLNRTMRYVRIVHTRLPRLATDQTALVSDVSVDSNVVVLLGVLQVMQNPPADMPT